MQFPDNVALADALAAGQERRLSWGFRVDWTRDGTFSDPNADLSTCVDNWDVDRQLVGNYPTELEVAEGHAAAQAWVTLSGPAPDGTPVFRLFSPYSGLHPGTVAAIDTPCELDLVVETSDGPVAIRQFTGFVRHATPSRRTGSVVLVLRDAAARLQVPVDLHTWAVDGLLRRHQGWEFPDTGGIALSWVVDDVLRQAGYCQGPQWHPDARLAWTLNGAALPAIGHWSNMDPWVTGTYGFGYYPWQCPNVTPAGLLTEVWETNDRGVAFRGFHMPDWLDRTEDKVLGSAKADLSFNPLTYGANNSNLLGMSWRVELDTTTASAFLSASEILVHLEDLRYDFGSSNRWPSYVSFRIEQDTGVVNLEYRAQGWVKIWRWTAAVNPSPTRWVNLYMTLEFTPGGLVPHIFADGVELVLAVAETAAWPPPAIAYPFAYNVGNHGRVVAAGPAQYAQIWYESDTLYANRTAPNFLPPSQTAQVDLSSLKLTSLPRTVQRTGWELLKDLVGADLGALYVTEHGVPTFDSRATIQARRVTSNVSRTLTLDDIQDADPSTVLESVVNVLHWELNQLTAEIAKEDGSVAPTPVPSVFAASKVDQFETAALTVRGLALELEDGVMQVRTGFVTYRPQAMGYTDLGGPSISWESTMEFYAPKWWGDGFTPYEPGSRTDPSVQPIPNVGVNAEVSLGWFQLTDFDPAHIRVSVTNTSTNTTWLAVDDSTPFLHIAGVRVVRPDIADPTVVTSVQDNASINQFDYRPASLPGGVWLQDPVSVAALATDLLAETAEPSPYFESLEVLGDPRTQLQDVVRLDDPHGLGGPIFASVVGIRRRCTKEAGLTDSLLLRTFGDSGLWIMDDPDYSIMDQTTIVS